MFVMALRPPHMTYCIMFVVTLLPPPITLYHDCGGITSSTYNILCCLCYDLTSFTYNILYQVYDDIIASSTYNILYHVCGGIASSTYNLYHVYRISYIERKKVVRWKNWSKDGHRLIGNEFTKLLLNSSCLLCSIYIWCVMYGKHVYLWY